MKEEDVYKDIIYAFKNNKLKFSAKDITNMIRNYMVYHKIYGISSVIFNKEDMNYYHFDSSTINIDYQLDLYDNVLDKEDATFQMIAVLTTILHELTHVEQFNVDRIIYNDPFICDQFISSIEYAMDEKTLKSHTDEYDEYHDYFIFEYYADIRAFIKFEKLYLKYLKDYIDPHIIEENNRYIAASILPLYESYDLSKPDASYPLLNNNFVCHINDDKFFDKISNSLKGLSEYDKLLRGLPVKNKTLGYLDKVVNEKVKTYKLFDDIKKMG